RRPCVFREPAVTCSSLPHIDVAQVFIFYIVLLFSLTVHEMAHAWTADRLGDPTARLLGRVSLNPIVHADPIGTVLFPIMGLLAVFNMLPIPPLDGGNVLAGLLPPNLAASFNLIRPYGFVLLYVLMFTGGFEYLVLWPSDRIIVSLLPTR